MATSQTEMAGIPTRSAFRMTWAARFPSFSGLVSHQTQACVSSTITRGRLALPTRCRPARAGPPRGAGCLRGHAGRTEPPPDRIGRRGSRRRGTTQKRDGGRLRRRERVAQPEDDGAYDVEVATALKKVFEDSTSSKRDRHLALNSAAEEDLRHQALQPLGHHRRGLQRSTRAPGRAGAAGRLAPSRATATSAGGPGREGAADVGLRSLQKIPTSTPSASPSPSWSRTYRS